MSLSRSPPTTHTVPEEKLHLSRAEQLLSLEQIDPYLYRGFTPKTYFNRRIYGGQTIAQSLMAAYLTVGPEYVCVCV
jgi:acyl-CoA thioesterase